MLEELIRERITGCKGLIPLLAVYSDAPAVFYQRAAPDASGGWQGAQAPRIDFIVDMQAEPSRNLSGVLAINIWCDTAVSDTEPGDIEKIVRGLFHKAIVADNGAAYVFSWSRSDNFEAQKEDEQGGFETGYTMIFAIVAMPKVETTIPCPLAAINDFTKEFYPHAKIIGLDSFEGWLAPDELAFYWELASLQNARRTNVCAWIDCALECHIFTPDDATRAAVSSAMIEHLLCADHVLMRDKSPMRLLGAKVLPVSDAVGAGQIAYTGQYGVLLYDHYKRHANPPVAAPMLTHGYFSKAAGSALDMAASYSTKKETR